mmetsp:Transcript_53662/g.117021  ORF Transcript_53662/g.117021 Transcript_53662/m.117021 type:complete len:231 (+) Transcript_53662:1573-2265(+)
MLVPEAQYLRRNERVRIDQLRHGADSQGAEDLLESVSELDPAAAHGGEMLELPRLRLLLAPQRRQCRARLTLALGHLSVPLCTLTLQRADLVLAALHQPLPLRRLLRQLALQLAQTHQAGLTLGVGSLRGDDHARDVAAAPCNLCTADSDCIEVMQSRMPELLNVDTERFVVSDIVVKFCLQLMQFIPKHVFTPFLLLLNRNRHIICNTTSWSIQSCCINPLASSSQRLC